MGSNRDQQFANEASLGPGLFGDQDVAQHGPGFFEDVVGGFAEFNAALETGVESALASAARVDLGFDGEQGGAPRQQVFGDSPRCFRGAANVPGGDGDAVLGE